MVGPRAGERGSQQLRRRHRMESIPGNFNVHLAAIEAPGCTTTSAASRTVSLDCQVQASSHRFNDKLYTSPLAQREPSIDRQGTRCAAPCCQELVMLTKEVAGGWSWRYRQASGFTCADRNINPAPARKLQRDRQNILLRDVAIARNMRPCAVRSGAARCQRGAPPCLVCIACFARILALLAPKTLFRREQFFML